MQQVEVVQYRWAGSWGPFRINVECGECSLSEGILQSVVEEEFEEYPVTYRIVDWLPNWWRVLPRGGWHAPIITVNGCVIVQGEVIDRGLLAAHIRKALAPNREPTGDVVFYKEGCAHCARAKALLDEHGIAYTAHDVVRDPLAARHMFAVVKRHVGGSTPVTVPQIWLDGNYIGGADALEQRLDGVDR